MFTIYREVSSKADDPLPKISFITLMLAIHTMIPPMQGGLGPQHSEDPVLYRY